MGSNWLSDTFKHRRREATHEVAFWKGNGASEETDATHVSVVVKAGVYAPTIELKWPEQKGMVETLEAMLRRAFEIGREDAKREVRQVIGCADR